MTMGSSNLVCCFLTGSQALYGQETLDQVADLVPANRPHAGRSRRAAATGGVETVLTHADAIRRTMLGVSCDDNCAGAIIWIHTFSPAKMWIAGFDALRTLLLRLHTRAKRGATRRAEPTPAPGTRRRPRAARQPVPRVARKPWQSEPHSRRLPA